jgi:hypothetical protein
MPKMNKAVVRRMIDRLERVPDSYDQSAFYIEGSNRTPCGTIACLAGEAVICSVPDEKKGLKLALKAMEGDGLSVSTQASRLLGIRENRDESNVFGYDASGWPAPFNTQYQKARTRKARAQVAVAYLKEALQRGAMLWDK